MFFGLLNEKDNYISAEVDVDIRIVNDKDEEVSELKTEILSMKQQMSNAFVLNEKETKAIANWIENHNKEFHNSKLHYTGIGGTFSYTFTPTSLGTIGEITCTCGQTFCFRSLM